MLLIKICKYTKKIRVNPKIIWQTLKFVNNMVEKKFTLNHVTLLFGGVQTTPRQIDSKIFTTCHDDVIMVKIILFF
jgi:hypothetical protein